MRKYADPLSVPDFIAEELGDYPDMVKTLLWRRGISSKKEAEEFLNPRYESLHSPFLMADMEKACRRILNALGKRSKKGKKEKIIIYSDYDADGIPGAVILSRFFREIGFENFEVYIPHRHIEGFGLNSLAVESFASGGASLIITVDCGIADVAPVEKANELGMDVIITDHHLPNGSLPPAFAILDSKREDDPYPYKMLCGSAVVWKLAVALGEMGNFKLSAGWEKWLLDMVGLATLADMVPLVGENRVLARYGLLVLRKSRRLGLVKLLRKLKIKQEFLTEDDIGFMLAPRINAASRMGLPMDAYRLLYTDDEAEAGALSDYLDKINNERKGLVASTIKEIKKRLDSADEIGKIIVMGNPNWRPGLLGLAAGNLADEYGRPVFLWGREGSSVIKGSCRSDGSVNVLEMMRTASDILSEFGGHAFSGGFSVSDEKIHLLPERFLLAYGKLKTEKPEERNLAFDWLGSLEDITWETWGHLERMSPFGEANPKPQFLFENLEINAVKMFGKNKEHLELLFLKKDGGKVSAIKFFASAEKSPKRLEAGEKVSLAASIERSDFRQSPELRLRITEIF